MAKSSIGDINKARVAYRKAFEKVLRAEVALNQIVRDCEAARVSLYLACGRDLTEAMRHGGEVEAMTRKALGYTARRDKPGRLVVTMKG